MSVTAQGGTSLHRRIQPDHDNPLMTKSQCARPSINTGQGVGRIYPPQNSRTKYGITSSIARMMTDFPTAFFKLPLDFIAFSLYSPPYVMSGRSSVVEHHLAKVRVVGSNLIARSISFQTFKKNVEYIPRHF